MKKTVTREVDCCDECGKELSHEYSCMKCGAIYCYDHQKKMMDSLPRSVSCSGSGDGNYCKKCARQLEKSGDDPLYESYMKIFYLRKERDRYYADFKRRAAEAEAACAAAYKSRKEPV